MFTTGCLLRGRQSQFQFRCSERPYINRREQNVTIAFINKPDLRVATRFKEDCVSYVLSLI